MHTAYCFAQALQGMNYQAVDRDATSVIMANKNISNEKINICINV